MVRHWLSLDPETWTAMFLLSPDELKHQSFSIRSASAYQLFHPDLRWSGILEFPSCNYPEQNLLCVRFFLLIRFYGCSQAGMQSLAIFLHLIGHLWLLGSQRLVKLTAGTSWPLQRKHRKIEDYSEAMEVQAKISYNSCSKFVKFRINSVRYWTAIELINPLYGGHFKNNWGIYLLLHYMYSKKIHLESQ